MGASAILKSFAKNREKALILSGFLTGAKAAAVTKILKVADHFSKKSEALQLKAVKSVEAEIRLLLPHENSRLQYLREKILSLLSLAKSQNNEIPRIPPTTHEKSAHAERRDQGTQLRLI